jgi:hypothetical protein
MERSNKLCLVVQSVRVDYTVEDYIWESKHRKHPINGIAQKGYFLSLFILNKRFSKTYTLFKLTYLLPYRTC